MEKVYREIGARIRAIRSAARLTQAEVAEKAGLDASFFGQLERGANVPSLRSLYAIAAALLVEPADLLPRLVKGKSASDPVLKALDAALSRLPARRRRFLLGMVRDIAGELK
jgi:transcriptional regulator with XRE-family HTH domain